VQGTAVQGTTVQGTTVQGSTGLGISKHASKTWSKDITMPTKCRVVVQIKIFCTENAELYFPFIWQQNEQSVKVWETNQVLEENTHYLLY